MVGTPVVAEVIHAWDGIRAMPTDWDRPIEGRGIHESVFRSYQVLEAVKLMLDRGDSSETVLEFIRWVETGEPF